MNTKGRLEIDFEVTDPPTWAEWQTMLEPLREALSRIPKPFVSVPKVSLHFPFTEVPKLPDEQ